VETNFLKLLDLLESHEARATCFFLGWVAERHPRLVKEAHRRGHDIASHGMAHQLPSEMSRSEFESDARCSKALLEDLIGDPVTGYRAAGFALPRDTSAYFEALVTCGYRYDSSIFPARHNHGGQPNALLGPSTVETASGPIQEFPVSVVEWLGRRYCVFGGGYLRLAPYALIRRGAQAVLRSRRPLILYLHPREIDPDQPRLPLGLRRRVRTYVNLRGTEAKLNRLLSEYSFTRLETLLQPAPVATSASA
jgi:polysaccharide deacetylase family protein (PEP-CTERM system associated)